jgi:hypothetical protein
VTNDKEKHSMSESMKDREVLLSMCDSVRPLVLQAISAPSRQWFTLPAKKKPKGRGGKGKGY